MPSDPVTRSDFDNAADELVLRVENGFIVDSLGRKATTVNTFSGSVYPLVLERDRQSQARQIAPSKFDLRGEDVVVSGSGYNFPGKTPGILTATSPIDNLTMDDGSKLIPVRWEVSEAPARTVTVFAKPAKATPAPTG